jgi:hypothetical protein
MALTTSIVPATPYFSSGEIKFSALRSNFKEVVSGSISSSELLRVVDPTNTDPIVPDATENSEISSSTNLKLSQFRNTIKYYNASQASSDIDLNLLISNSSLWNGNLSKTIRKTVSIAGTCGSTNGNPSASIDGDANNVFINITGHIHGYGGSGGVAGGDGENGGTALSINNTKSDGTVYVKTFSTAQVYGGGGGGGGGAHGGKGGNGQYTTSSTYYTSVGGPGGTYGGSYDSRCRQSCERAGAQWVNNCYKHTSQRGQNCGGNTGHYDNGVCYSDDASSYADVTACKKSNTSTSTSSTTGGNGGAAVSGGDGRGYLQSKSNGATFNGGLDGGTNAGTGGNSGSGGNGGDWAQDGQGGADYNGIRGANGTAGPNTTAPNFNEDNGPELGGSAGTGGAAVSGTGYSIDNNSDENAFIGSR